jgi:Dolichyl-phosphate-mannose-protein mannosyltransferase
MISKKSLERMSVFLRERRVALLGAVIIGGVVLTTFHPILGIGFFAEDYTTLDLAARLNLFDFARFSLGQCVTSSFCRPANMFGVQFEYWIFGNNPAAFRTVEILVHLANCLLLYTLVTRVSHKWQIGFLAAITYCALPAIEADFLWFNIIDHSTSFFYLSSLIFWHGYLERANRRDYLFAIGCFVLALLNKEFGLVLPLALFLMDRWIVAKRIDLVQLARRYAPFMLVGLIYGALLLVRLSAFTKSGYSGEYAGIAFGPNMLANLAVYLAGLAYPLQIDQPLSSIMTMLVTLPLLYFVLLRRDLLIAFLCSMAILPILPVLPLSFAGIHYLYLSLMAMAVLFAVLFHFGLRKASGLRAFSMLFALAMGLIIYGNASVAADAFSNMDAFARQYRLPLRPVFQQWSQLPDDSYFYLVNSPLPTAIASGMFAMRYGAGVSVSGTDEALPAELSRHTKSFVYYFDDQKRPIEIPVGLGVATQIEPAPPVDFTVPIRMEGYQVVNPQVQRGQSLVVLFYWNAVAHIEKDYTLFAHLVDANGQFVTGMDSQPHNGQAPTHSWDPGRVVVDWAVIPISEDVERGNDYRLEIGWYYLPTMERASVVDAQGLPMSDRIVIQPIGVAQ